MKVLIRYHMKSLEKEVGPNETFQRTFRALLGDKTYGTAGWFVWEKNDSDDTVTKIPLSERDTPSSVSMDIDRPQVLEWKQARVWKMLTK